MSAAGVIAFLDKMEVFFTDAESIDTSYQGTLSGIRAQATEARAAVADLMAATWRAELLLRDMANAGYGDHGPANDLRAALARCNPAALSQPTTQQGDE